MGIVQTVAQIRQDPSWQAKAWILERQFPQEFGRRQLIAHAGPDGESPMIEPGAEPAKVTIIMQTSGKPAPWTFAEEVDPEPHNGSDPWESDHAEFAGPDVDPPAPAAPPPPAEPKKPVKTRHPLDSGGKPRDPDADHD